MISDYVELPSFCGLIDLMDYSKAVANLRQILLMPHLCQSKSREILAQSVELLRVRLDTKLINIFNGTAF